MLQLGKIDLNRVARVVFLGQNRYLNINLPMADIKDTQKKASSREALLARAREQYPDRTFADLDATEPQEGTANLDDAINEMLENLTSKQKTYDEQNSRLVELLTTDPGSAEFMNRWIESGDPRTALIETFGDDLGMSEEAKSQFASNLEGWRERKAENDRLSQEAEDNWQTSLSALEKWGNAKGLSLDQKRDVMVRLLSITFNGMVNKYAAEDFDLAYNAINHDTDVANARAEGEVAGRNAKIAANRRERGTASTLPPAPTGRQGGILAEPKPKKQSFWGEVNNG